MVITDEFKFPRPPRLDTGESPLKVKEIDGMSPVLPINHYTRRWREERNRPYLEEVDENLPPGAEKALQMLISKVNRHLEEANVAVHLGLVKEENGYALDIYDCTSGLACFLVKDDSIHINDLPELLRNLQQEVGILIDLQV